MVSYVYSECNRRDRCGQVCQNKYTKPNINIHTEESSSCTLRSPNKGLGVGILRALEFRPFAIRMINHTFNVLVSIGNGASKPGILSSLCPLAVWTTLPFTFCCSYGHDIVGYS